MGYVKRCDCGEELEFIDCEWRRYNFTSSEEIVYIYGCRKCKNKYTERTGNFELELDDDKWEIDDPDCSEESEPSEESQ